MKKQCLLQISLYVLTLINFGNAIYFPNIYPKLRLLPKLPVDAGDPLILTPLLEKGLIQLAKNLSRVSLTDDLGFPSYAGFFTVNKKFSSNLYFWYFPPFSKNESAPVILWLQGGPGASSLYGLFTELGPLTAHKDGFKTRQYHWALDHHLLFIDNPVGSGFSFTNKGYCDDEDCVARNLHTALHQFFQMFSHLKKNPFFIAGESYAGKYLPSLGMKIHLENDNFNTMINLKGIAMGNLYCDPVNQLDYGHYLYQHGLIDDDQLKVFVKYQTEIEKEIKAERWEQADILMDRLMTGDLTNFSYFTTYTGFKYYYNFLQTKDEENTTLFTDILHSDSVRRSIHVGGLPLNDGEEVQLHLIFDIMQSVAPIIEKLLINYPIMIYSGQLDIIVAYPLTENVIRKLNYPGAEEYSKAQRQIWSVDEEIAGYWKKGGNLLSVLVRNAGHMVPHDQPKWALDMISRFIYDALNPIKVLEETETEY